MGGVRRQVVEQTSRLVLLDVESGQSLQVPGVMVCLNDPGPNANRGSGRSGDDIELIDVEAQHVEPFDPLLHAPGLVGAELLGAGQLLPQVLVDALHAVDDVVGSE